MNLQKDCEISYQTKGSDNYMVIELKENQNVINYCLNMVESNKINGLLSMHSQVINGCIILNYNITDKFKIVDFIKNNEIKKEQGLRILQDVIKGVEGLQEYFLPFKCCLLDLSLVFLDYSLNIYIPFIPLEVKEEIPFSKFMKDFYLALMRECFASKKEENDFDNLVKYLIQSDFSVKEWKKQLKTEVEKIEDEKNPKLIQEKQQSGTAEIKIPCSKKEKYAFKALEKTKTNSLGFKIPGQAVISEVTKTEKLKKEKMKKEKKGLFERLKNKNGTLEVNMNVEDHVISQGRTGVISYDGEIVNMEKEWSGTCMIQEDSHTVALGVENTNTVYLENNGEKIIVTHVPFHIGKDKADYKIYKDVVSRYHATIDKHEKGYVMIDNNSKNHTYINGEILPPYSPYVLNNGDSIKFADEEVSFHCF